MNWSKAVASPTETRRFDAPRSIRAAADLPKPPPRRCLSSHRPPQAFEPQSVVPSNQKVLRRTFWGRARKTVCSVLFSFAFFFAACYAPICLARVSSGGGFGVCLGLSDPSPPPHHSLAHTTHPRDQPFGSPLGAGSGPLDPSQDGNRAIVLMLALPLRHLTQPPHTHAHTGFDHTQAPATPPPARL